MMYKCHDCGAVFDENETIVMHEPIYIDTGRKVDDIIVTECPQCRSENFDEAKICRVCGEYGFVDCENFCEDCIRDKELNDAKHDLKSITNSNLDDCIAIKDYCKDAFNFQKIESLNKVISFIEYLKEYEILNDLKLKH